MTKKQQTFTDEFRILAVKRVLNQGLTIELVASDLNIGVSTLHTWISRYKKGDLKDSGITSPINAEQKEIQRLKRELEKAKKEAEILKKAIAFMGQEHI